MNSFQLAYTGKKSRLHLPVKVKDVRYATSRRRRICENCGDEIHKGELYYSYKPILDKRKDRCINCKPKVYNDISEIELEQNLQDIMY